ncbi:MAG: zf-HC2 domain-containing protein [Lachnospiraceae bacterium]|nr:zf-HC2 domain-containing protein [Lachnospiraceae bacterium]
MKQKMDCKEFEKLIPAFIKRKLGYRQLRRFMEHALSCGECKEELTIQFLVSEGMARLEEGGAFDLQKEMALRMQEAGNKIRVHNAVRYVGIMSLILVVLALAVILFVLSL